jgi:mannose-6-phosphate isomerase class I
MSDDKDNKKIVIHIDNSEFKVEATALTGAQIRALPTPAIGQDRDLYLEVPGPGDDQLIADDQRVELKNGMHFFTTPRVITPGT